MVVWTKTRLIRCSRMTTWMSMRKEKEKVNGRAAVEKKRRLTERKRRLVKETSELCESDDWVGDILRSDDLEEGG